MGRISWIVIFISMVSLVLTGCCDSRTVKQLVSEGKSMSEKNRLDEALDLYTEAEIKLRKDDPNKALECNVPHYGR